MQQFRFNKWKVYEDSQKLFSLIFDIVKKLPKEYRFEIGSQIIRSCLSVSLNIAEGSGKHSNKEFCRFIDIALGSTYETVSCADTLYRNMLVDKKGYDEVETLAGEICRQLGGIIKNTKKAVSSL
ncbi:MAG: four helix bundle protein [Patescibacteria group bacterium]